MPQSYTNGHAPDAYVMKQRTRWVTCDLIFFYVFAFKVLYSSIFVWIFCFVYEIDDIFLVFLL